MRTNQPIGLAFNFSFCKIGKIILSLLLAKELKVKENLDLLRFIEVVCTQSDYVVV